ncbi:MAG: c-type cytochrome domain-containing protein, partial [Phycisphaeraceae bacterium]
KESAVPARGGLPLGLARVSLIGVMTAMPFVGHLGGNMTHGQDYLTEVAPSEGIKTAINLLNAGTTEEAVVVVPPTPGGVELANGTVAFWNAKIQPVLNNHCTACHNSTKQNGKLRLDTLEWAMKGGSVGGTIEPGDAEFSEIYRRVILPPSHDEFMPTNVKKYGMMSQEDIIILGEWLTVIDGDMTVAVAPRVETTDVKPEPVKPAIDPAALKAITSIGGNAQSLSQEENPDQLTVKFSYLKELDPASVAKLESGADNIAWLTFEGSSFGDDAAKELPAMPKLTRLNLKDSVVTDAGLAELPELPSLTWLNLFGTEVSDAGLDALTKYDTLEKLYLTGTKVTAEGVEKLRKALPDTEIYSDHDGQFQFTPVTPDVTPGDPAKDDKAGNEQAAKPVNANCPVGGVPIKPGFVSTFEGKTIGFCCGGCKGKFDADPSKFKAKLQ